MTKPGYSNPLPNMKSSNSGSNLVNPTHTHEFDAQLLILGGEMTILRDGVAHTYRQGDTCEMPAGTVHEERVGPEGVRYLAARRHR